MWQRFLGIVNREILQDAGCVTAEYAKEFAETEFEKYRVIQDRLFQSDFDKFNGELPFNDLDKEWTTKEEAPPDFKRQA